MPAIPEVFPFAALDNRWSYPAWIRGLRRSNGVYVFRDRETGEIVYIGESHSDRLYSTLTRHFQAWTDAYDTAGVTYYREEVDIAVIVVPADHALYLQNELICALVPRDNRLQCARLFGLDDDAEPEPTEDETDDVDQYPNYGASYDSNEIDEPDEPTEEVYEIELTAKKPPPDDYDYDIPLLIEGIAYDFDADEHTPGETEDIPF